MHTLHIQIHTNTQYLHNNGYKKFFTWYDYKSWYPIGRPIGTTIYPGLQFTATFIKNYIMKDSMSINDICCYIPAWFGVVASVLVGMITYECTLQCNTAQSLGGVVRDLFRRILGNNNSGSGSGSGVSSSDSSCKDSDNNGDTNYCKNEKKKKSHNHNKQQQQHHHHHPSKKKLNETDYSFDESDSDIVLNDDDNDDNTFFYLSSPSTECAVAATGIMGMVPAHLTRSIGGGFDNESVALSAMCLTFYFWVRSLRANDDKSYLYGIATGVSYFYVRFYQFLFSLVSDVMCY